MSCWVIGMWGTTMIYTHVLNRGGRGVHSPVERLGLGAGRSLSEDWIRTLYREGFLDATTFQERISRLERLRAGELKPVALAG